MKEQKSDYYHYHYHYHYHDDDHHHHHGSSSSRHRAHDGRLPVHHCGAHSRGGGDRRRQRRWRRPTLSNCMLAIFQTQLPADGAHLERTRQALPPSSSFVGGWVTAEEAHAQLDALAAALASDVAAMQQLQLRLRLRL
jgi:hypothetical protein